VDRHLYRFDQFGNVDRVAQDIFVISAEGGEPKQLTADRSHNFSPLWSPDGREILFSSMFEPDSHAMFVSFKIVNLKGIVRALVSNAGFGQVANWTPDGQRVVFAGAPGGRPYGSKNDLWVINRDGMNAARRVWSWESMARSWAISPCPGSTRTIRCR
jgi:Tol biopolymer transport system component